MKPFPEQGKEALEQLLKELQFEQIDLQVEQLAPEEEAAQRLSGEYEPTKLKLIGFVKLPKPADFVKLDFIVESEDKK